MKIIKLNSGNVSGGEVQTTLYLNKDGIYTLQGDGTDDQGVDVVISYDHHREQQQTQIDPGIPASQSVIEVKRVDDGVAINNYDEEDLSDSELLSGDVQDSEDAYWEHKGDAYRERD